jgi:hypothetical protein
VCVCVCVCVCAQVAEAIHRRIKEGSVPGQRNDGMKIGLALEGGA